MFRLSLMRKDMLLLLERSQQLGVPMPVSESAYAMLTAATAQGLGDLDVSAILAFQERMAGMDAKSAEFLPGFHVPNFDGCIIRASSEDVVFEL